MGEGTTGQGPLLLTHAPTGAANREEEVRHHTGRCRTAKQHPTHSCNRKHTHTHTLSQPYSVRHHRQHTRALGLRILMGIPQHTRDCHAPLRRQPNKHQESVQPIRGADTSIESALTLASYKSLRSYTHTDPVSAATTATPFADPSPRGFRELAALHPSLSSSRRVRTSSATVTATCRGVVVRGRVSGESEQRDPRSSRGRV